MDGRRRVVGILLVMVAVLSIGVMAGAQTPMIDAVREAGVLRMGWALWYPYCYIDETTGQPAGVSVDLAQDLAAALGVRLEFVEGEWSTLIMGLQAGKYDMWMNLAVTLPRALEITFTDPILIDPGQMACTSQWWEEHKDSIRTLDDLDRAEFTVVVGLGSNSDTWVTQNMRNINILRVRNTPTGLMSLRTGEADLDFHTAAGFNELLVENPDLVAIPGPYTIEGTYPGNPVCFAVAKGDQVSVEFLNHWIAQLYTYGVIANLVDKYTMPPEMLLK